MIPRGPPGFRRRHQRHGRAAEAPLVDWGSRKTWRGAGDLLLAPGEDRVYLLTLYGKNVRDDLTSSERRAWRRVLEEIENESA